MRYFAAKRSPDPGSDPDDDYQRQDDASIDELVGWFDKEDERPPQPPKHPITRCRMSSKF